MIIFWVCSAITLGSAVTAAFVSDIRRAALALWIAGLGIGGLYLSMGAELLAIIQWIVSTLVAISFIFYGVMFGEYGVVDRREPSKRALELVLPVILGLAFATVIWFGAKSLPGMTTLEPSVTDAARDVVSLGRELTEHHFLSLEILALTLFLVIVGSGVVARPESQSREGDAP